MTFPVVYNPCKYQLLSMFLKNFSKNCFSRSFFDLMKQLIKWEREQLWKIKIWRKTAWISTFPEFMKNAWQKEPFLRVPIAQVLLIKSKWRDHFAQYILAQIKPEKWARFRAMIQPEIATESGTGFWCFGVYRIRKKYPSHFHGFHISFSTLQGKWNPRFRSMEHRFHRCNLGKNSNGWWFQNF